MIYNIRTFWLFNDAVYYALGLDDAFIERYINAERKDNHGYI